MVKTLWTHRHHLSGRTKSPVDLNLLADFNISSRNGSPVAVLWRRGLVIRVAQDPDVTPPRTKKGHNFSMIGEGIPASRLDEAFDDLCSVIDVDAGSVVRVTFASKRFEGERPTLPMEWRAAGAITMRKRSDDAYVVCLATAHPYFEKVTAFFDATI